MVDVATPSGAAMFDGGAQDKKEKKVIEKPEKPDEETYKAALKKAEKEHAASMEKFVSRSPSLSKLWRSSLSKPAQVARQPAATNTDIFFCRMRSKAKSRLQNFQRTLLLGSGNPSSLLN